MVSVVYYENHRTVKRDKIFVSLPCPISLKIPEISLARMLLLTLLAWTTKETESFLYGVQEWQVWWLLDLEVKASLLHLWLNLITFRVIQITTFMVKFYYIYG